MREIDTSAVAEAVADCLIKINYRLSSDMEAALSAALAAETDGTGREVLSQICENEKIAREDMIPICQDTGMAVIFLEIGQDVHFTGGYVEDAVNEGVRRAYTEGYLRKSVVKSPFDRVNTGDNTPAVIHTRIVPGNALRITACAKGFGSENTSRIFMLKPSDGEIGVRNAVLRAVRDAGPNACPPLVVGVGIGGNFEKCAVLAKHALTKSIDEKSEDPRIRRLEAELLEEINKTGIGAAGLGGDTTAIAVKVETYPTHIAGLPVAVNICCHVNRHISVTL